MTKNICLLILLSASGLLAQQQPARTQSAAQSANAAGPPLFIREDWLQAPGDPREHPAMPATAIKTPNVELKFYGQTPQGHLPDNCCGIWQVGDFPGTFLYTGTCMSPCGATVRNKNNYVDLRQLGKIRWRTKQTGFHYLRPAIKLADGTWLVGDHADGPSSDFLVSEILLADVRWHLLNPEYVVTTKSADWVEHVDLSKVDEVGFVDLMPGNLADKGHGLSGASRVDWIEIYGTPVPRAK